MDGQMSRSSDCLSDVKNVEEVSENVKRASNILEKKFLDHNDNTIKEDENQQTVIQKSIEVIYFRI